MQLKQQQRLNKLSLQLWWKKSDKSMKK